MMLFQGGFMVRKTKLYLVIAPLFILVLSGTALAGTFEFQPNPSDLYDLDHNYAYRWGIAWNIPDGEAITAAWLFFDDIRNWDNNSNVLYVRLLNTRRLGVRTYWDGSGSGDYFQGQGVLLNKWENLPSTAQDITYYFDGNEIAALTAYAADGRFGLGFDPDCHFYNKGIKLTIQTNRVPETGASIVLLAMALVPFVAACRVRR